MRSNPLSIFLWVLFVILGSPKVQSQVIAPVQITPQLIPPYSVYLEDYAQTGIEKLRLILLQRDLSVPSYQIRLRMSLKFNGREIIRTSNNFVPSPIFIEAGLPVLVSGVDLSPYLSPNSWEVLNGFNLAQYQATKALQEGSYEMCFSAYDFSRPDVLVSNVGCSFYYLSKSEPPLLNMPACGTNISLQTPQQILFSWTPLNTGSLNSAGETEYELSLYEIRPKGRNPNDVAQSTPPIFTVITEIPQYIYGIADPPLVDSLEYAWRVRAKDKSGRDAFRNQGYSAVCDFKYGGLPGNFRVGVPENLRGRGINERTGEWRWKVAQIDTFDVFRIQYKKVGSGWEWFSREVTDSSFRSFEFEADKEYEARVQGKYKGVWGNYTSVVRLKTKAQIPPKCGELVPVVDSLVGKPLLEARKGMIIRVEGFDMRITEVSGSGGYFSGKGKIGFSFGLAQFTNDITSGLSDSLGMENPLDSLLDKMPYLNVTFTNLYISENRESKSSGRIAFESKGVDALVGGMWLSQEQYKIHKEKQQLNVENYGDLPFFDDIVVYNFPIESVVVQANGDVLINGQVMNTAIKAMRVGDSTKTVIIEDKNGDQWIIKPDGSPPVRVEGGGLPPMDNLNISPEALELLKKALKKIKQEYTEQKVNDALIIFNAKDLLFEQQNPDNPFAKTLDIPLDTTKIRGSKLEFTKIETITTTNFVASERLEALQNYQVAEVLHDKVNVMMKRQVRKLLGMVLKFGNDNLNVFEEKRRLGNFPERGNCGYGKNRNYQLCKINVKAIF